MSDRCECPLRAVWHASGCHSPPTAVLLEITDLSLELRRNAYPASSVGISGAVAPGDRCRSLEVSNPLEPRRPFLVVSRITCAQTTLLSESRRVSGGTSEWNDPPEAESVVLCAVSRRAH
jgi:hypothetical protein